MFYMSSVSSSSAGRSATTARGLDARLQPRAIRAIEYWACVKAVLQVRDEGD